jgi:hypothetical protein
MTIEIERYEGEGLRFALSHQRLFLDERLFNFVIHPPACQGILGAAEQHFIPEAYATVYFFVDIIAGTKLLFIKPATNSTTLEGIVETLGKCFVVVVIADEARIE